MKPPPDPHYRHRFPAEIISHAVWLYHVVCLSLRDVELLLAERGVVVSYETVRRWCKKFGASFADRLRRRRPRPGDKWHMDEVFIRIQGVQHYLWRAVDQNGVVLDILVQARRDANAAKRFFRRLLPCFIDGCPAEWQELPIPGGRIVVGLDGGCVRNWGDRKTNFEVIVGRSLPEDRDARYVGLVHGYDRKPKRRLFDMLKSQGLQANQDVTFLTDGGEEVRALTELVTPTSEHVLDWFHITMRLTVLQQYTRGVAHHDDAAGELLLASLDRIKWLLWHGNQHRALETIGFFEDDVSALEVDYPNLGKFARATHEFAAYITSNAGSLINYGERYRAGERISSCLAESTVNAVISKRFAKRQQMQWTPRGAQLLLQTRTRALDGTLRHHFERWYPGLANNNDADARRAAA
jgi:hypothetical protein